MSNSPEPTKAWANPTPAALVALAIACFGYFAVFNGHVTAQALPLLGCWLIGGFVVQFLVALLDLKGGNLPGGNTFLYFSAFFMLTGGLECFFKATTVVDPRIDGWAWLALSLVVLLWAPAFSKGSKILFAIVLFLCVAAWFIALMDLGVVPRTLSFVPGYALLICGLLGIYLSAAIIVNGTLDKKIFPNP